MFSIGNHPFYTNFKTTSPQGDGNTQLKPPPCVTGEGDREAVEGAL